jgi:hypothetical protein
MQFEKEYAVK